MNLTVKKLCPTCSKQVIEESSTVVGAYKIIKSKCGHVIPEKILTVSNDEIVSEDGRRLRPFQSKRIKDVELSDARCLLNQEMGLGKTVIAASTFKLHFDEMSPILIICKAGLKLQMFWEMHRWIGKYVDGEWQGVISQVIETSTEKPVLNVFKVVIVSYETLSRAKWVDDEKYAGAFKTIFIDECQKIQNPEAAMTKAVRKLCVGGITVKREPEVTFNDRPKIDMMANDCVKFYLGNRFKVMYDNLGERTCGKTECNAKGNNGDVTGIIYLDKKHVNSAPESEVLDTILHEIAHAICPGSGHTPFWKEICVEIGAKPEVSWKVRCEGTSEIVTTKTVPKHIIAASGTPIKNNAGEYFTILNILKPEIFAVKAHFINRYCDSVWDGYKFKVGGIRSDMMAEWKRITDTFIFRDLRIDVEPELPLVDRQWRYNELAEDVAERYAATLGEMQDEMGGDDLGNVSFQKWSNILAYMNTMRQLTGLSKIEPVKDYVADFLFETDRKLVIFVHHVQVGNILRMKLTKLMEEGAFGVPLMLTSDLDADARQEVVRKFREDGHRILIASTQAAGEGLNLQFCSDCIIMERQWNPANEEQAEARFTRIGSTAKSVIAMYPVAVGTIDEFFAELVEKKRSYMSSALDGKEIEWEESSLMKGLAEKLLKSNRRKWSIK